MSDRARDLVAMAAGAAAIVLLVAAFTVLGGGDADATYCDALGEGLRDSTEPDLIVFLDPDASQAAIDRVGLRLREDPAVASARFRNKAAARKDFEELYADNPELIASVEADVLPTSFEVRLAEEGRRVPLLSSLRRTPSVYQVVNPLDAFPVPRTTLDLLIATALLGDEVFAPEVFLEERDEWRARLDRIAADPPDEVRVAVLRLVGRSGSGTPSRDQDGSVLRAARTVARDAERRCDVSEQLPYV